MKKVLVILISFCTSISFSYSQNGWTQLAGYPGSGSCGMVGIGYQGTGMAGQGFYGSSTINYADWWQYNPTSNSWSAKASLTASHRYSHSGFCIGEYAYLCMGSDYTVYFNDLWQYNGTSNTWTQKASFPGTTRYGAIAQATGTKAYVGLGEHDASGGISDYFTDFYEYDANADSWTAKAVFAGQARYLAFSFLINDVIYVVGGRSETGAASWVYLKDMWAYDIASNTWSQKTSYPGNGSMGLGGFVLGQYAYVGMGYNTTSGYSDFWRYNPQTDSWTQLSDFPGGNRYAMMCFNLGTTGYLGCGRTMAGSSMQDFWKYEDQTGITESNFDEKIILYPVPANNQIYIEGPDIKVVEIYTSNGSLVIHKEINHPQTKTDINISDLVSGFYYAKVSFGNSVITKKVIKN